MPSQQPPAGSLGDSLSDAATISQADNGYATHGQLTMAPRAPRIQSRTPSQPPPDAPPNGLRGTNSIKQPEQEYRAHEYGHEPYAAHAMAPTPRIQPRAPSQPLPAVHAGNGLGGPDATLHTSQGYDSRSFARAQHAQPTMALRAPGIHSRAPSQPPTSATPGNGLGTGDASLHTRRLYDDSHEYAYTRHAQPTIAMNAPRIHSRAHSQPPTAAPLDNALGGADSTLPIGQGCDSHEYAYAQQVQPTMALPALHIQPRAPSQPPPSAHPDDDPGRTPHTGQEYQMHYHGYTQYAMPVVAQGDAVAMSQGAPRFQLRAPSRPPPEHSYGAAQGSSRADSAFMPVNAELHPVPVVAYGYDEQTYASFAGQGTSEYLAPVTEEPVALGAGGGQLALQTPMQTGYWSGAMSDGGVDAGGGYPGASTWDRAMEHSAMHASQAGVGASYGGLQEPTWAGPDGSHAQDSGADSYVSGD